MRKRSESQVEELLRELPKVTDDRPPSEIYRNIKMKTNKRKLPSWIVPGVATLAVGLIVFILSPTMTEWQNEANQSESRESSIGQDTALLDRTDKEDKLEGSQENTMLVEEETPKNQNEEVITEEKTQLQPTSVYENNLDGYQAFTYPIPDKNAQVLVPITVMSQSTESETWFEKFIDTMATLTEEEWGLAEYYPLNVKFSYDEGNQAVKVDLPLDHQYGLGSTAESMFISALQNLFPEDKVKKLIFTTDGQEGIMLGNYGELSELENVPSNQRAYFFLYSAEKTQPYIVPTEDTFGNITEALTEMELDQTELGLKASLPEEIDLDLSDVNKDDETLHLRLTDDSTIGEDFLYSLEAISLTAKNFGYSEVKLENAGEDQVGPFDLSEVIHVPVAPNKK